MGFPDRDSNNVRNVVPAIIDFVKTTLLILTALPFIRGQIPTSGQCPIKTPANPIDLKQITGQWYEIEASPTFLEYPYKCISIKVPSFFEKTTEISIDAVNRVSMEFGTIQKLTAKIPESSNEKDGQIHLTMIAPFDTPEGEIMYGPQLREAYMELDIQIIATDYNNWALVWGCKKHEGSNSHTELIWILSRQRTLTEDQYKAVNQERQNYGLEGIKARDTIQYGCSKQDDYYGDDEDDDDY